MRGSGGYLFPAILGLFLLCLVIVIHGIFSLAVFGCCGGRDHDPCCVRYSAGYSLCSSYCYTLLLFLGWDPPYWWWDMVGQPCVKPQFWDWEVAQPEWTSSGNEMCPVELSRLLGLPWPKFAQRIWRWEHGGSKRRNFKDFHMFSPRRTDIQRDTASYQITTRSLKKRI